MTFGKTFLASLLGSFVSMFIVGIVYMIIFFAMISGFNSMFEPKELKVSENTVLKLDLDENIGDLTYMGFNKNSFQVQQQFGLFEITEAIKKAKTDDHIKGIFLNVGNVNAGMATVKEIRDALEDFQSSGKFLVAYNDSYTKKGYYLSSIADEVYVFPSGTFDFLGLGAELTFFKGALDKLGVEMQIIRGSNNKFKSAVEPFMYDHMSDANRVQTQKYLDALWSEMLVSIQDKREVTEERLNEIADSALIRKSSQAVDYLLADGVKYYDEVLDILKEKAGTPESEELELLSFRKYAIKNMDNHKEGNIAVVFAEGDIVDGKGEMGQIGGTSMSQLIREAREDSTVSAVVLRVNSPGGSALASDIIWREVILTKAVKPVIVSMGDVAASGGYYISCAADKIYAEPNTITGSIGVFGIIPFTGKLFEEKLGITFDRVQTNDHSVLSLNKKLSDEEYAIIQQGVDDIYLDFITKVAEGRGMTTEMVDDIGQGRVWAGKDAKSIGLIDEYGGLNDAISEAANRANIAEGDVKIKVFSPYKQGELIKLLSFIEDNQDEDMQSMSIGTTSTFEMQLIQVMEYAKYLESNTGVQARLPYLYRLY